MFRGEKLLCALNIASLMISKLILGDNATKNRTTDLLSWTEGRIALPRFKAKNITIPVIMAFLDWIKKHEIKKPRLM